MTKPVTLGEIRVFDNGDGIIDPEKDTITGLQDEKAIPVDSFSSDSRVRATLEKLGLVGFEGVSLEKASRYFSQEMTATERATLRAEIHDQHKQEVGRRATEKAEKRYQDWLRKNEPELERQKAAAIRAADKARARQEATDSRYGIDSDATQKIARTDFDIDGDIEDSLDALPEKVRFQIFEALAWIQPKPDEAKVNYILGELLKNPLPLSQLTIEEIIGRLL